jgi:hypothetical protein
MQLKCRVIGEATLVNHKVLSRSLDLAVLMRPLGALELGEPLGLGQPMEWEF